MKGLRAFLLARKRDNDMAQELTFMKFMPTYSGDLQDMLRVAGLSATGGPHPASIPQLPIVMVGDMAYGYAASKGVIAKDGEDPILALLNFRRAKDGQPAYVEPVSGTVKVEPKAELPSEADLMNAADRLELEEFRAKKLERSEHMLKMTEARKEKAGGQ